MNSIRTSINPSRLSGYAGVAASHQILAKAERLCAGPVMGSAVATRDRREVTQANSAVTGATRGFATATQEFRLWRPPTG